MSAYPNLHLIAYGTGGARLNRSELAVEAADALERLAALEEGDAPTCGAARWGIRCARPLGHPYEHVAHIQEHGDRYPQRVAWMDESLTPAHDKEKS